MLFMVRNIFINAEYSVCRDFKKKLSTRGIIYSITYPSAINIYERLPILLIRYSWSPTCIILRSHMGIGRPAESVLQTLTTITVCYLCY